jgi:adenylate cyclase
MKRRASRLYHTLGALRRRHVIRVAGAYAVCAWLTVQAAAIILPPLQVPEWVLTVLVVLALLGLPVVAILTWVYDITPEGVVRTLPRDAEPDQHFPIPRHWNWRWLDYLVIAALLVILAWLWLDRLEEEAPVSRSIAVLPFADLGEDADHSHFSEGLAESLIDSLATVPGLRVMSRTSSFSFRDRPTDARDVAARLGVDAVLEGSVRRAGDHFRVSVRLVDGRQGHSLWSEAYEGSLDDVFEVQDSIARSIAAVLQVRLGAAQTLVGRSTVSRDAYDEYLRGRASLRAEGTPEALQRAITHFQRALRFDADFGLAQAGLCTALWQRQEVALAAGQTEEAVAACEQAGIMADERSETHVALGHLWLGRGELDHARSSFNRALTINPDSAEAHAGFGRLQRLEGEAFVAEQSFRQAISLDPGYWQHYALLADVLADNPARRVEAIRLIEKAIELEPRNPDLHVQLGQLHFQHGDYLRAAVPLAAAIERQATARNYALAGQNYYYGGDFAAAESMYQQAVLLAPQNHHDQAGLAESLRQQGDQAGAAQAALDRAIELARFRLDQAPDDLDARAALMLYLARSGDTEAALQQERALAGQGPLSLAHHRLLAESLAELAMPEAALGHLRQALEMGLPLAQVKNTPVFQPYLDDPRWVVIITSFARQEETSHAQL